MSNEWEFADLDADAKKWRSIQKILKDWVSEVAFWAPGVLSDGITPMCGKFETEELWRQANMLLSVFTECSKPGAVQVRQENLTWINKRCTVKGEDFEYKATCICSFPKTNGKVRYIVEDNGRLFIQRREQLTFESTPPGPPPDHTAIKNG